MNDALIRFLQLQTQRKKTMHCYPVPPQVLQFPRPHQQGHFFREVVGVENYSRLARLATYPLRFQLYGKDKSDKQKAKKEANFKKCESITGTKDKIADAVTTFVSNPNERRGRIANASLVSFLLDIQGSFQQGKSLLEWRLENGYQDS